MPTTRPIEILLVDDSPTDRLLTTEALQDARVRNNLSWAEDGVEALRFLRREGEHANAARPDLIFLDLHMPRMDGRELLEVIKADPSLRAIPVVVLTTSRDAMDVQTCYLKHANCYIAKPVTFPGLAEVVRKIEDFWFEVVSLPPSELVRDRRATS